MERRAVEIDYKAEYERLKVIIEQLREDHRKELVDMDNRHRDEMERQENTYKIIIKELQDDLKFNKNIIKGILHF